MTNLNIVKLPHHEPEKLCETRAAYRQGRKLTAVKVYTINDESRHLIVVGVPKLQLRDQVKRIFAQFGDIKLLHALKDYPCEPFEEAFHIHYGRIQSARIAKHFNDRKNFYGGSLHVFYAPELESLAETREKLIQRRKDVWVRIEKHKADPVDPRLDPFIPVPIEQHDRKKKHPARSVVENQIYNDSNLEDCSTMNKNMKPCYSLLQPPYQQTEMILRNTGVQEIKTIPTVLGKRKNYKGCTIDEGAPKTKIFRPRIVDTTKLLAKKEQEKKEETKKNYFINAKKVDRGITIKVLKKEDKVKRIVMKNSDSTQLVRSSEDLQTSIQTAKEQIRVAMSCQMNVKNQNE